MKSIENYIEEDRIKKVTIDKGKSEGLMERSRKRFKETEKRDISDENSFLVLENVYESIRESIESLMALEGYKSSDHVATIAWAAQKVNLDKAKINKLHKYRKLRNASRYEAEKIEPIQAKEILEFGKKFIKEMEKKVKDKEKK